MRIRVAAPPIEGAANAELVRFIADRLAIPRARVRIVAGAGGRRKTIAVTGMAAAEVRRALLE